MALCERMTSSGQCSFVASPDSKYCKMHAKRKNFNLSIMASEVQDKLTSDEFHSLDEETAMSRVILEQLWNLCKSKEEIAINASAIAKQMEQIQKLVQASHSMRVINGQVLSLSGVEKLIDAVLEIITDEIDDDDLIDRISKRLFDVGSSISKNSK